MTTQKETCKAHTVYAGDTLTPFGTTLVQSGNPTDLSGKTVKVSATDRASKGVVIVETSSNVTAHPTYTFTADATADRIKCVGHTVREGEQVVFSNSGGALPTGLSASTRYFARDVQKNSFKVSEYEGTAAIDITGAGTGTHSFYVVGQVQYDWQTADVSTVRGLWLQFKVYDGSECDTFPNDTEGIQINIVSR